MSVTDRFWHTATLIGSDRVLVAGSPTSPVCEVYNVVSNTWTTVGSMAENRYCHSTVLLPSGKVMVIGGYDYSSGSTRASTEIFDPATGLWTSGGSMAAGRYFATAVNDGNGHVYVVGGYDAGSGAVGGVESYSIVPGTWTAVSGLSYYSLGAAGSLLANGSVVIAGGSVSGSASTSSIVLVLPPPPEDADHDGLTFAQEVVMGYDPSSEDTGHTGVSDASKDWDGDGFSNLFEIKKASLSASMNSASDNSNLPVGASRLFYSRRMSATYIANSPAPKDTVLALQPNWAPAPDPIHIESEIPYPYLSGILMGLQFPKERFSESNPNYPGGVGQMRYSALIASKGQPTETQTAELEDSQWWVHVEPSLPFETTHHFLILSTTSQLGAGGAPGTVTKEWSGKAVTIAKNKHDSESFEYLSQSTDPECVVVENQGQSLETCKAEQAIQVFPISIASLSVSADIVNGNSGHIHLANDKGESYPAVWDDSDRIGAPLAHYEKRPPLSIALLKGISESVAFVSGATPALGGKIDANLGGATVKLRGVCETIPGLNFPETVLEIDPSDGLLRFDPVPLTGTVGSQIKDYHSGITFSWQVTVDDSGWIDIGKTKFRAYVTDKHPTVGLFQESIFRISCKGASEISGTPNIINGIWSQFQLPGADLRLIDGSRLTYYRNWDTMNLTCPELLANNDGQCGAFVELFNACVGVQGIDVGGAFRTIQASAPRIAVKRFRTLTGGNTPGVLGAPAFWKNLVLNQFSINGVQSEGGTWSFPWVLDPEFDDDQGVAGQGTGNPKAVFVRHFVTVLPGTTEIFDPSYGQRYPSGISQWLAGSLAGYIVPVQVNASMQQWFYIETISSGLEAKLLEP